MRFTAQSLSRGLSLLTVLAATALLIYFVALPWWNSLFYVVTCDAYGHPYGAPEGAWVSPPPGWTETSPGSGCYSGPQP